MLGSNSIIGVCGAGAMGAGIAQVAAHAGHSVIVLDQSSDALERGRGAVKKGMEALERRGKISTEDARVLLERITWTCDIGELAKVDLCVEAIVEHADAKAALFADIEKTISKSAILATNTSSLSVTSLAARLSHPSRFLGLHFFNPAPIMKLVEVVAGAETDMKLAESAAALMGKWGKTAVSASDVPGFIVNRVARPFYYEGWRAYEENVADATTIDFLYKDLAGFKMGPLELGDLIGHDINAETARSIYQAYYGRVRFAPSLAQAKLVTSGRIGRKAGRGVYDYRADNTPKQEPPFIEASSSEGKTEIYLGGQAVILRRLFEDAHMSFNISTELDDDAAEFEHVCIMISDGRPAGQVASELGKPVAVLDFMRDAAAARSIACSCSCDAAQYAVRRLSALTGKKLVVIKDRAGLIVLRTLLQLANSAADAVRDGVAHDKGVDLAMMNGVNYPFGPLAWAREFGLQKAVCALEYISSETGDAVYQPSEYLRVLARSERKEKRQNA